MPHSAGMSGSGDPHTTLPTELTSGGLSLATLIAAGTRDGIAILGPEGELAFWNSAAATITGWSRAEAAKQNLGELVRAPDSLIEIRNGVWIELRYSRVESDGRPFLI